MNIVITGGCGFIGSNYIRYVLNAHTDYSVVNFDKLTYAGNPKNVEDIAREFGARYSFVQGDISDASKLREVLAGADMIVNFAAETHVDRSILDPEAFLKTDIMGTYNILEFVRENPNVTFIQISTDEVYGSIKDGEFMENSPFEPNSPYSASKAGGDLLCRAYVKTYNVPVIVTHSCNVYGPYQYPEKFIPLFTTNLLEGKKVPVYGKGDQIREWIFTEDYCSALDTIIHKGEVGEVYNIGSGERVENIAVTRKILELTNSDESMIENVTDRPGHDVRYAVNADKTKSLGWKPSILFDDGLKKTVDWYRENEAWWKEIKSGEFLEYYKKQYGTI